MRLIKRYVAKNVLGAMLLVLLGVISLDLIFRIVEEASRINANYTLLNAIIYELLRTPSRIYMFMPMVGLIGCLTGLGALANSSELIVMRSGGISTFRLLWMALVPALFLLVLSMLTGEYIAPKTEQMAEVYRAQANNYNRDILRRGIWVRDGENFVQIGAVHSSGILYGVNIFHYEDLHLKSITQAKRADFSRDSWLLENVQKTRFLAIAEDTAHIDVKHYAQMHWQSQLKPELLASIAIAPDDLPLEQLWRHMHYLKAQSLNSASYELAFWGKVFYPLVMISLVIIGISFVFGPLRQVTMGYRVFWGVLAGIILKTFQDTLGPISTVYGFPAMYAMLLPALLCGLIGFTLLARVR